MIKRIIPFRFPELSFLHNSQNGHAIYSEKDFNKMVDREKARADRGGKEFSVVIFELRSNGKNSSLCRTLLKLISERIRITDEIGWFDKKSPCILLVDITANNAKKIASKIHQSIPNDASKVNIRILSYPSGLGSNNSSGSSQPKGSLKINLQNQSDRDHRVVNQHHQNENDAGFQAFERLDPFFAPRFPLWKRSIDIIGASAGILVVSPICIVVSLLIKIVSPGPVFFRQKRVGFMGKSFNLWKFRTMNVQADSKDHKEYVCKLIKNEFPMSKLDSSDPQIIPFIGKALRISCIDELPQLINVLRGEMSLVGPRPCLPYEYEQYLPWHKSRILTVPGITGLWQVNGKNNTTFKEMVAFDISYGRKISLLLDLKILIKTIWVIVDQTFNQIFFREERSNATYV